MKGHSIADTSPNQPDLAEALRLAMRGTAASVAAITVAMADRSWRGATINSMTSVSLNPPSILVSLESASQVHGAVLDRRRFGVNLFSRDHAEMAAVFADPQRHDERFASGTWSDKPHHVPVLAEAVATIICELKATLPFGTHSIIVGQVESILTGTGSEPLVYHNGRYGGWAR